MRPSRQNMYQAVINRMVHEALTQKHEAFVQEHQYDTDDQLLQYLRECARQLGHSPHQKEIIGWPLFIARFGNWHDALRQAHLQIPRTANTPSKFKIVVEEENRQKLLYRERKAQKKRIAQQRIAQQEQKKREHVQHIENQRATTLNQTDEKEKNNCAIK